MQNNTYTSHIQLSAHTILVKTHTHTYTHTPIYKMATYDKYDVDKF